MGLLGADVTIELCLSEQSHNVTDNNRKSVDFFSIGDCLQNCVQHNIIMSDEMPRWSP